MPVHAAITLVPRVATRSWVRTAFSRVSFAATVIAVGAQDCDLLSAPAADEIVRQSTRRDVRIVLVGATEQVSHRLVTAAQPYGVVIVHRDVPETALLRT